MPAQPRACRTIADLFEAAAQLLDTGEPERLTTNHIAARAGYSIGTLYRYFPSKLALVRAMALQELRAQEIKVRSELKGLTSTAYAEPAIRILLRAVLHPFAARHRVHAGVMRLLASVRDPGTNPEEPINVVPPAVPWAALPELSNDAKFTILHAVTGTIEAAMRSRPELIASREFEDQLVGLVVHLAAADKGPAEPVGC
jgi:AcrR family transcriptional regulator